jgi:biopolymer transport protein ExbD
MLTALHERPDDPHPELNTTPVIDVMLVLLTMHDRNRV